jgi:hypothetical protein
MEDPEQQKEVALSGDSSRRLSVAEAGVCSVNAEGQEVPVGSLPNSTHD